MLATVWKASLILPLLPGRWALKSLNAQSKVKGDVGSDHLPVHIRLNSHEVEKALTKAVHRLDKANWQKFRKELKSIEMGDLTTPEEIEKAVELLETSMICALDKSCQSVKQKTQDFFISEKNV